MVRRLAAVVVALLLAGCLEGSHGLEVANHGLWDARVRVVYTEWVEEEEGVGGRYETFQDETYVSPGKTERLWYPDEPLHVRIERAIDGVVLYEEYLTEAEFDDEHGRVEIVVFP